MSNLHRTHRQPLRRERVLNLADLRRPQTAPEPPATVPFLDTHKRPTVDALPNVENSQPGT